MKCTSKLLFCAMLGFLLTLSSCVKDNELELENTIQSYPLLTSNLIFSTLDASVFTNNSARENRIVQIDTTVLELNSSNVFMAQLTKANLTFQLENSLKQDFKVDIEFLNDFNESKYAFQIPVSSGSKEKQSHIETKVAIENSELATFMEATKVVLKITILRNTDSSETANKGALELQSQATYFHNF